MLQTGGGLGPQVHRRYEESLSSCQSVAAAAAAGRDSKGIVLDARHLATLRVDLDADTGRSMVRCWGLDLRARVRACVHACARQPPPCRCAGSSRVCLCVRCPTSAGSRSPRCTCAGVCRVPPAQPCLLSWRCLPKGTAVCSSVGEDRGWCKNFRAVHVPSESFQITSAPFKLQ